VTAASGRPGGRLARSVQRTRHPRGARARATGRPRCPRPVAPRRPRPCPRGRGRRPGVHPPPGSPRPQTQRPPTASPARRRAGSDVLGLWHFDDVALANEVANAGLVFILFQRGRVTKRSVLRAVALPAGGMATWGVVLTAAALFCVLYLGLGWAFDRSLLL